MECPNCNAEMVKLKSGYYYCRKCHRPMAKEYREKHREEVNQWLKNHYKANKELYRLKAMFKAHGVTVEWYEAKLKSQGGKCAICGSRDPKGKGTAFCVDHDHESGKVRGLLCNSCNLAIGHLGDSAVNLERGVKYLRGYEESHPKSVLDHCS